MSTARITVRIDETLQQSLGRLAQAAGTTESQIVRDAIKDYVERSQPVTTCYDVFKAAGWIGCLKGGPKDLSTNPKYMEGFGRD